MNLKKCIFMYLCSFFYQTPSNIPTPDQKFVPFINTDQPFTHQLPKSHDQGHANPEEIKMRSRQFDSFLIFWAVNQIKSAEMSKISAIVKYFSRGSAFVKDFVFYNQTTMTGINMCFCFLKSATKILWKKWDWGCCLLICWWRALFSFSRLSQLVLLLFVSTIAISCCRGKDLAKKKKNIFKTVLDILLNVLLFKLSKGQSNCQNINQIVTISNVSVD